MIDEYFKEDIKNSLMGKMDEVKKFLSKDNIKITPIYPSIDDLFNLKNGIHKSFYEINDNELKIYINDEMIGIIKEYINKNAVSLDLPETVMENLDLKEFKNLKSLSLNNDSYSHDYMMLDALDKIKSETNLKCINITNSYQLDREVCKSNKYSSVTGFLYHAKYDGLTIESESKSIIGSITIKCNNMDEVKYYINYLKSKNINNMYINIYDKDKSDLSNPQITIDEDKKEINIKNHDLKDMDNLISILDNDYKININIENKTYDDMDLYAKKYKNISVNYGEAGTTSLNDFVNMRHVIDYYKSLLPDDLSPLEKTMYLYDIVKSFQYNESDVNKDDSRYIPNILKTGNIVCVGYSNLLSTLLKEEGVKAYRISVSSSGDGHERVIVKMDDSKYNIHGLYVLDPTWDSKKDGLSLINKDGNKYIIKTKKNDSYDVIKDYDVMSSYIYFMIPILEYNKRFPNDSAITFIKNIKSKSLKNDIKNLDKNDLYYETLKYFFEDEGYINYNEVKKYCDSDRLSYDDLIRCLKMVKKAEGYGEDTLQAVKDSIEVRYMTDTISSNKEHLKEMLDNSFDTKEKIK